MLITGNLGLRLRLVAGSIVLKLNKLHAIPSMGATGIKHGQ